MVIEREFKGKSIEQAIQSGLSALGVDRDDVTIEVVERESKGFLGFGKKEAVIKLSYNDGRPEIKEEKPKPQPKPQPKQDAENRPQQRQEPKPQPKQENKPQQRQENKPRPQAENKPQPKQNKVENKPKQENKKPVSIEEAQHSEAVAENFLKGVLGVMGIDANIKSSVDTNENTVHIELSGDNMGFVIGRRGETLDALQYLATIVTNKAEDSRWRVSLDTENYREKRTKALIALANKTAANVTKTGKSVALEPMNPQERRIIHSALQENKAVTTFSTGQEPKRKIVIAPQGAAKRNPKSIKKH